MFSTTLFATCDGFVVYGSQLFNDKKLEILSPSTSCHLAVQIIQHTVAQG
ncbi:hypothetical protein T05_2065 [Trichinella murrelli]|uniref:Uncharacterized protein n=1 Tax=Trichinella murrelli TaxID=144512 RepID=A0A0V0SZL1_9BILA|nr:hypothetical protein T05_2065 [Trichinella murrelli]